MSIPNKNQIEVILTGVLDAIVTLNQALDRGDQNNAARASDALEKTAEKLGAIKHLLTTPCPFCGFKGGELYEGRFVCPNCDAIGPSHRGAFAKSNRINGDTTVQEAARRLWNTRHAS